MEKKINSNKAQAERLEREQEGKKDRGQIDL